MDETETQLLAACGAIPNSRLPLIVRRGGLPVGARDGGAACALLSSNGWGGNWVYGVYDFWHFHTKGHEVLACVLGRARLGLGGETGIELDVASGDVLVLPAGVGHKCLHASPDFQVAGGYPPGQEGDIVRPGSLPDAVIRAALAALPLPATDPLSGKADGVVEAWRRA